MLIQNKIKCLIFLILLWGCSSSADTKLLRKISIASKYSSHYGSISLDNDGYLISDGSIVEKYKIPNDPDHILRIFIEYVADKDGYKTKYILVKEEDADIHRLTAQTLKSIAG